MSPQDTPQDAPPDTLYETLEVSPRACPQIIHAAYRCLAQFNHPDHHAGHEAAVAHMAQINLAYTVLSDPVKRQRYDQTIALKHGFTERRGAGPVSPPRHAASEPSGVPQSRPFVLRPL